MTTNIENITKTIYNIENNIAKYIYEKYIKLNNNETPTSAAAATADTPADTAEDEQTETDDDTTSSEDEQTETDDDTIAAAAENHETDECKYNAKCVKNRLLNMHYRNYLKNIFDMKRNAFRLFQNDILKEDLKNMSIADKAYEINPKTFNINDYESLPDVLRCTFIRKYKHRYYRCKKQIINNDNDVCKMHVDVENIYYDKYNELLETLAKTETTETMETTEITETMETTKTTE